jgi:hypothetical protein
MDEKLQIIESNNCNIIIKNVDKGYNDYNELFENNGGCWVEEINSWIFPFEKKAKVYKIIDGIKKSHELLNKKMDSILEQDYNEVEFEKKAKQILDIVSNKNFKSKIFDYEKIQIPSIDDDSSDSSDDSSDDSDIFPTPPSNDINNKINNIENKLDVLLRRFK